MSDTFHQELSHYRLLEKIGEGGMGVVWKAKDKVLGRTVAIKVLPPDISGDEGRRRMFLREAQLASSISDAHIVQVYEFARDKDLDFIVMEYVEGAPLSRHLQGRPLPADKVAQIGLQATQALSRAHRSGLLHRDLKPANLLITEHGDVKIVDFGLAALFSTDATEVGAGDVTHTAIGIPVSSPGQPSLSGTIPYMSPEQARGDELDPRSDIFSMGSVLYEMTTGQRPFNGATSAELLQELLQGVFVPPHKIVPKLPLELDRIIRKALSPRRAERYQTMDDLAVDLKRFGRDLESGSSPSYEDLSGVARQTANASTLVVFPMDVRAESGDGGFIGQSFAEALAINLARVRELKVLPVPRPEEVAVRGTAELSRAARELGAGRLLHGSLMRGEREVHASVYLIDVADNSMVWGSQKDAPDGDMATLAATLAKEAASQIGGPVTEQYEHIRLLTGGSEMSAFPETTTALAALRRVELEAAVAGTKRLVEKFPSEPAAHALYTYALYEAWRPEPSAENREALGLALLELREADPKTPYVDLVRGMLAFEKDGKPRTAIELFQRVLDRDDLSPTCRAWALRNVSQPMLEIGDTDAAMEAIKEAIGLDPVQPWNFYSLSHVLRWSGRFEEALTPARQAGVLEPWDYRHRLVEGLALLGLGRFDEALEPIVKACSGSRSQEAWGARAVCLAGAGQTDEAASAASGALRLTESFDGAVLLARYSLMTGDRAEALRLLQRAVDLGLANPGFVDGFDELAGDAEFEAVVRRIKERVGDRP